MTTVFAKPTNNHLNYVGISSFMDKILENEFLHPAKKDFSMKTPVWVNTKETKAGYTIEVAAPSFEKENFKISFKEETLCIAGEKKPEVLGEGEKFTRKEFEFSSFERTFLLPKNVKKENISAEYKNGTLLVLLPVEENKSSEKTIDIKVS